MFTVSATVGDLTVEIAPPGKYKWLGSDDTWDFIHVLPPGTEPPTRYVVVSTPRVTADWCNSVLLPALTKIVKGRWNRRLKFDSENEKDARNLFRVVIAQLIALRDLDLSSVDPNLELPQP